MPASKVSPETRDVSRTEQDTDGQARNNSTTKSLGLEVSYRSPASLIPYKGNARTHPKQQIRKIKESISNFGFRNPVLIDKTSTIVTGHARVKAATELKLDLIPTICLDDLSPAQVRAYRLADNRLGEDSSWDRDLLRIQLLELEAIPDLDLSLTGFEIPELDLLLQPIDIIEDRAEEVLVLDDVGITRRGDLWLLDQHRIYCGDARDEVSYSLLLDGRKAHVVFTDPPYNVTIDGHASGNGQTHHREFAMASGEMTEGQFSDFLKVCLEHLSNVSVDGAIHYVAMDWRHISELLNAGKQVYDKFLNLCVWAKDNAGMGSFYRSEHELIFVFRVGKIAHRNNVQLGRFGRNRSNVWHYPGGNTLSRSGEEKGILAAHPTPKPIAMISDALLDSSAKNDIVLDSFLGSGSTLLAAERTRRRCFGMDIDRLYVDLAVRRWQKLTGDHAIHAVTGVHFDSTPDRGGANG